MSDPTALVAELQEEAMRLSGHSIDRGCVDSGIASNLADRAADLIAQQAATIVAVTKERDENRANWLKAESEAYELKYAAAGGEDAPGSAHAVTVADVDRWRRETEAALTAAEAERDRLRETIATVTAATSAYLPPGGISKDECINRVLAATDNPEINAVMLGGPNGRS